MSYQQIEGYNYDTALNKTIVGLELYHAKYLSMRYGNIKIIVQEGMEVCLGAKCILQVTQKNIMWQSNSTNVKGDRKFNLIAHLQTFIAV